MRQECEETRRRGEGRTDQFREEVEPQLLVPLLAWYK